MIRTGDHAFVKELNKSIVRNLLRTASPLSRSDLARQSGLNKATISAIIDEWVRLGLVTELGPAPATVGRRPVLCQLNPDAGHAIGLHLEVDHIRGVLVNLAGTVVQSLEVPVADMSRVPTALDAVCVAANALAAAAPASVLGILGAGLGVPGLVHHAGGTVLRAPNLRWVDVALRDRLEERWPWRTFVDNEANTGALGERLWGLGQDAGDLVYVSVGHGVGAGIVVAGELVRGAHGLAGEFGHMTLDAAGVPCSCDSRGCLEMYASEKAIVRQYQSMTGQALSVAGILAEFRDGGKAALDAIRYAGHHLGIGIANMVNALDPALVVVGNRLLDAADVFLDAILASFAVHCFGRQLSNTRIELSHLGRDAGALGAASLVLHAYFSIPKTA